MINAAHNVPLGLALDLGVPAALMLHLALALPLAACAAGLTRRRRDQIYPAIALAAAGLLFVQGLVDFSPEIPANAILLAYLMGLGFAQAFPGRAFKDPV